MSMPLLGKYWLPSTTAYKGSLYAVLVNMCVVIFISSTLFTACSTPEKPSPIPFDFEKAGEQLAYYYNAETTQYSLAASYPELPIPDSSFWKNRIVFLQQTITQLDQFIQTETKHSKAKKWKYLLEKIDSNAVSNSLAFYHTFERFDKILQKEKLKPLKKLDVFNQKLNNYPLFIKNIIPKINLSSPSEIREFEMDLEQMYFLLKNDLPKQLKLHSQEKKIQKELHLKIKTATFAIKNMLSYCRSKRNEM